MLCFDWEWNNEIFFPDLVVFSVAFISTGDGSVAAFTGLGFQGFYRGGDQMFQLSGETVPEPASVVLGVTRFLALLSTALFKSPGCHR
jgi:hypothetical protein